MNRDVEPPKAAKGSEACLGTEGVAPARSARRWRRWFWRPLWVPALVGLILASGQGDYRPTSVDLAAAPYRYSIVAWEASHLPDKWLRRASSWWPASAEPTPAEKAALVRQFFDLGLERRQLEYQLRRAEVSDAQDAGLAAHLAALEARRQEMRPAVETTIEETLTQTLVQEGIVAPWGGVFPPVDAVFGDPPAILMLSPRDRIYRQQSELLRSGLSDQVKEELEENLRRKENLSAIIEGTAGLSVYPSVVSDTLGMPYAMEVTAHEWLHHWFFFRPLGRNFRDSPEMLTLNETAATIAGQELGELTLQALIATIATPPPAAAARLGQAEGEATPSAAQANGSKQAKEGDQGQGGGADGEYDADEEGGDALADAAKFDFAAEMRQTRRWAETLLAQGDVEGAEAYMEARRQIFVANGYNLRKLNQAYFAFHGSYATGPGSVSPIGSQLMELRRRSDSLSHFLETVAQFGSYQQFLDSVEGTGTGIGTEAAARDD